MSIIIGLIIFLVAFVIGAFVTVTLAADGIVQEAKDKESVLIFYSKKKDQWTIVGDLAGVYAKIRTHDKLPRRIHD